jgi:hypothetical protein
MNKITRDMMIIYFCIALAIVVLLVGIYAMSYRQERNEIKDAFVQLCYVKGGDADCENAGDQLMDMYEYSKLKACYNVYDWQQEPDEFWGCLQDVVLENE